MAVLAMGGVLNADSFAGAATSIRMTNLADTLGSVQSAGGRTNLLQLLARRVLGGDPGPERLAADLLPAQGRLPAEQFARVCQGCCDAARAEATAHEEAVQQCQSQPHDTARWFGGGAD
eukprot:TRINITY_DN13480_c0_g1_i4.p3 TRINITY_DN13480_c0_g1~~TRINITY_DN13480_c0_g1_i4.p3  ORF type:complete len:119 (+),score=30.48 TRINITY_DN13480_c0_g1_i4:434-790(+)